MLKAEKRRFNIDIQGTFEQNIHDERLFYVSFFLIKHQE